MDNTNILWSDKLNNWYNGRDLPTYHNKTINGSPITKQFFFETSPIIKISTDSDGVINIIGDYRENFIESHSLDLQNENPSAFKTYLKHPKNPYATSFNNLDGKSKLIIPTKIPNIEYTSIKLFIDNAPLEQQQHFWKLVAEEAFNMLKIHNKIWISTHGLGIPYFHVRIDIHPKYYGTIEFI